MNYRWGSDWVAFVSASEDGVFVRASYLGSIVLVADLSRAPEGWRASIGDNDGDPEEVFASRDDAAAWVAPRALAALQDAPDLLKRREREAVEDVARFGAAFGAIAGLRARPVGAPVIIDGAPGYSPAFEQLLQDAHDEGEPALDVRWWVGHEKRLLVVTKADGTELSRAEARKVKDAVGAAVKLAKTKEATP